MKRSTGASRIASSRICVPSTFVVTNSRAPSAIDFSTCDSAAAFTITSTPSTTSRTSSSSRMSPCTNESRSCEITSARFSMLPAYVSASSETTSYGVDRSRWRMKFDEMNPAPPVTRTRISATAPKATDSELLVDRVQGAALDVPLDAGEVLADQREDEALRTEHDEHRDAQQQRPGEVSAVDPVPERVHTEDRREQGAERTDREARPLDRTRPEASQHVQRKAGEPQRRVARAAGARSMRDVDLDDARAAGQDERLGELLPADHAEHRLHGAPPVRVEGAAEVGDRDASEAPQHAVDQARRQRPAPRVVPRSPPPARHVGARLDCRHQLRDVLRRVLEVAVHRHDDLAAGACEPGVHGRVLPEVPLEADSANPVVRAAQALDLAPGPVGGAVVHEDQLVRPRELLQRRGRTGVQLGDRGRLLEHRHDDA